jgi:hypothetical protein
MTAPLPYTSTAFGQVTNAGIGAILGLMVGEMAISARGPMAMSCFLMSGAIISSMFDRYMNKTTVSKYSDTPRAVMASFAFPLILAFGADGLGIDVGVLSIAGTVIIAYLAFEDQKKYSSGS